MPSTATEPALSGSRQAAISNLVVRTMSEYTGRGPTKARTYITEDVVTVVLQDTLTKGERSLVSEGLHSLVLNTRKAFQGTMRGDLVSGVEGILGRRVYAFLSDNHIDPDIAVETFVLAPRDAEPPHSAADGAIGSAAGAVAGAHG
jgi:uncharacterized protein YbcI